MPGPSSTRCCAISSDLDLHSVLDRIVVSACRMTGARYGALGVLGNSGELVDFVTSGLTAEQHAAIGDLPRGKGILGLLIQEPHPLRLRDLQEHPASYGFPRTTRRWRRSSACPSGSAAPSSATST